MELNWYMGLLNINHHNLLWIELSVRLKLSLFCAVTRTVFNHLHLKVQLSPTTQQLGVSACNWIILFMCHVFGRLLSFAWCSFYVRQIKMIQCDHWLLRSMCVSLGFGLSVHIFALVNVWDARRWKTQICWMYFTYLSDKEPAEVVCKWEAHLEKWGMWLEEAPVYHNKREPIRYFIAEMRSSI